MSEISRVFRPQLRACRGRGLPTVSPMSYRRPLSTPTTGPRQGTGMDWRIGLEPVQWLIALGTGLAWLLVVGVLAGMTPAHASTAQPAAAASAPLEKIGRAHV